MPENEEKVQNLNNYNCIENGFAGGHIEPLFKLFGLVCRESHDYGWKKRCHFILTLASSLLLSSRLVVSVGRFSRDEQKKNIST